ncbi:MAG: hypothetical protein AB1792_03930 [Candidatus Zixiibacteriota bacterium]
MLRSRNLFAGLSAVVLVFTVGCSGPNKSDGEVFRYPLTTGDAWQYQRAFVSRDLQGEKLDTMDIYQLSVRVAGKDSMRVSPPAMRIHAELREGSRIWGAEAIYQNKIDGLYCLALSDTGHATFHARPKGRPNSHLGLTEVWPLPCVVSGLGSGDNAQTAHSSGWTWYDPPLLVLRYPLEGKWRYRDAEGPEPSVTIDKEVLGRDTIGVPAGAFDCYEIAWRYNGVAGVEAIEHVTTTGLVRRAFRVLLSDPDSTEVTDITELLHYTPGRIAK